MTNQLNGAMKQRKQACYNQRVEVLALGCQILLMKRMAIYGLQMMSLKRHVTKTLLLKGRLGSHWNKEKIKKGTGLRPNF